MTKSRSLAGGLLVALALGWAPSFASAQSGAPAAAPAADARLEAEKGAFLGLPETDRKAAQEALGWLGFYNGALDGTFGKRTRDSIVAYQQSVGAPGDGVISPAELEALKTATQRARTAVDFALVDDLISGVRIGAPLKLLTKLKPSRADTTLESGDGAIVLTLSERAAPPAAGAPAKEVGVDDSGLGALYAQLAAEKVGRKIAYKALKAGEFFVVAGEEAGEKFYTRFARAPADWPQGPALRGFTFEYPSDRASDFEKLALAVANSFDPFADTPASHGAAAMRVKSARSPLDVVRVATGAPALGGAATGQATGAPIVASSLSARPSPTPLAAEPPAEATATAFYVGPGQALTALPAGKCAGLLVNGRPATLQRADPASGLALIGGDFAAGAQPPRLTGEGRDLVVLSLAPGAGGKATLEASPGALAPLADGRAAVVAALGAGAGGAPAFDRSGALAGIVAPIAGEPRRIGPIALVAPHALIGAAAVAAFLGTTTAPAPADAATLEAGEIAIRVRGAIAQVVCRP